MPANVARILSILALLIPAVATRSFADDEAKSAASEPKQISYAKDVEPILRRNCLGCHQGAKKLGSYKMTNFASLVAGGETGTPAIVPGKPDESYLIDQITSRDGRPEMPKDPVKPLSSVEVETIRQWIEQGAQDDSAADSGPKYTKENPPIYTGAPALASIDASPITDLIAVAGLHEVILLNSTSGELQGRLVGLSPRINSVRFSPDGTRLAVVGGTPAVSGEVQIWDVDSQELELSLPVTYDALTGASWSPDGTKLAFGASDNTIRAINSVTGEQVLFQGAHDDWVRSTVFTEGGSHLVSVARDMSCKLTEVETERFIDNITSITPGALSGGLSSVDRFPGRDEILVGGSDGIPKIYRCFRETARKIGDDANLIRSLPQLTGRIFSVAISTDGTRMAAAATLDGQSEIRIWESSFDSKLTDDLKTILGKRVQDRSADEKKKLSEYRNSAINQLAEIKVDQAAVFAIRFAKDNTLFASGNDGQIRHFAEDGKEINQFAAIAISTDDKLAGQAFDAKAWHDWLAKQPSGEQDDVNQSGPQDDVIERIEVLPSAVGLNSPYEYAQLIVTAVTTSGDTVDVTRWSTIATPDFATATAGGLIRATDNGSASITVTYGSKTEKIDIVAAHISGDVNELGAVDFIRDVNPILSRLGCNAGTCHGAQKGKNGFKLSLRGYDPIYDVRALTDDLAARRINAAAPEESLMLRKPLGLTPHQGGALMREGDPNHVVLRRWIADGSKLDLHSKRAQRIEVHPINPIVQSTTARQQVRVVAFYADGSSRDVTQEAFIESGNGEVATTEPGGLLQAVRRGEAPILARYEGNYAATTMTVMGDRSSYQETASQSWSHIDELVAKKWARLKIAPSELCDDATFLRRVYLDLTGLPPKSDVVRAFLKDPTSTRQKRAKVIDELIGSEAYVDYWTNKWADLLQVNRKFLGVEGSQKFHDWIKTAVKENRRYDEFARQILTATGSNNENPAASYFKILRTPEDTMENTTHLFLGIRFNCNKCHDHPFERWTQDQYYEMSAFFAQVGLEKDPVSGDRKIGGTAVEGAKPLFEKVLDKKDGDVKHARTNAIVPPDFPFEVAFECGEGAARQKLAAWMTDADNPYFARSYVNRLWGYLFGVGLIEPIDDIRAGNPPTNPELLDHLAATFVESNFDTQQILRKICNSRTYQLSVESNPLNEDDAVNYSRALPRRLPAEVIYDAVHTVTGARNIPGTPKGTRATALNDAGVKLADGFLQNLGRPARESACECERSSELQLGPVMALISGPTIGTAISDPKNELERIVTSFPDDEAVAEELFLRALGRLPTKNELGAIGKMNDMIRDDHKTLVARLEQSEAEWKVRRAELEKRRQQRLTELAEQIAARTEEIKPERERLEQERQQRIKAATEKLEAAKADIGKQVDKWAAGQQTSVEWHPLAASKTSATNKAVLTPQSDRSILASGNKDKGVYTVEFTTGLKEITGFRLEALTDPSLPNGGPGLPKNGNFVVTEFEIKVAPKAEPQKSSPVKIAAGKADFLQGGFSAEATFDGQNRGQGGWAVAEATGLVHWITYKLAEPIKNEAGSIVTIQIHQFHNAEEHRLGRFRISATTAAGDIPLGYPEPFAAALATPKPNRSEAQTKLLSDYVAKTDAGIRKANEEVGKANAAVPPDAKLVAMQQRQEQLKKPTPDDPQIVRLRDDVKQSTKQLANIRLTAAEDLTWALINSPAFLFNH